MVHVVSILDVIIRLGETVFQSRDVSGAVWSGVLEFESNAKGVSFVIGEASRLPREILLPVVGAASEGSDQSLR